MNATSLVAIITALTSLAGTIPAIILAVKGQNKANQVENKLINEVQPTVAANKEQVNHNTERVDNIEHALNGHTTDPSPHGGN